MKIKNSIVLLMVLIGFFSCKEVKLMPIKLDNKLLLKNKELESLKDFKNWQFNDILIDTLAGISLTRLYDSLLINKKKTKPDSHHIFNTFSKTVFTHIKLNIFPDGGVARLRLYGSLSKENNKFGNKIKYERKQR
jgi:hypothetical protein